MKDILNKLIAILGLVAFLVVAASIVFLDNGKQVFHEIDSGIASAVNAVAMGLEIVFFTALGLGVAYGIVRIRHTTQTQVIRDGKDGRVTRAVIHQGQFVQIMDLSANPNMQIEHFTKLFAMAQKAAQASNKLIGHEEYEEEYEDIEEEPLRIEGPADEYLSISEDYQPHADEFLSAKKLVVGITGSGKSNTTAALCEELGRLDVPMILADTENEYGPLCDPRWLPHGTLVDRTMVNPDNASEFGRHILERGLQVVLNLQSYELEEGAWVMINLIAGLKQWQEERANELRIPCEFLLEEATTWLPQNVKESPLNGTDAMSRLQDAFFNDLVRKGRKRGLGLTVICQKIAEIDKRALQCEVKLLHRQTELIDLEKYAKMGISNEETLLLQNGEGFFFSSKVSKMLMQIRRRHSPHGANTPGLSELRQHQKSRNSLEKQQANSEGWRNGFEKLVEPIENVSKFEMPPRNTVGKGVPETTQAAILDLYREGHRRTDIQGMLDLNGDEYWMVKAVCDAHDRSAKGGR